MQTLFSAAADKMCLSGRDGVFHYMDVRTQITAMICREILYYRLQILFIHLRLQLETSSQKKPG